MKHGAVRRKAAILGIAAFSALVGPVHAADAPATGISLSPAKVEVDQTTRAVSQTLTLTNNDAVPRTVAVAVTGLTHDLDGNPSYDTPPPAGSNLQASSSQLVLAPHAPTKVNVSGTIPTSGPGLYAGVVFTVANSQASANVNVVNRLAAPILVRGPKPWKETSQVGEITVAATGAQTARVEAVIKDTGDVHIKPTGTAEVFRDGTKVATLQLTGETILPGLARRLGVSWDLAPTVTKGPLDVRIHITKPVPAEGAATVQFDPSATVAAPAGASTVTTPPGAPGAPAALGHRAKHHARSWLPWLLGLLGLLALIGVLALLLRRRNGADTASVRALADRLVAAAGAPPGDADTVGADATAAAATATGATKAALTAVAASAAAVATGDRPGAIASATGADRALVNAGDAPLSTRLALQWPEPAPRRRRAPTSGAG